MKKYPAKFVSFVERWRSLNFRQRKIRFFCFIRCEKNRCKKCPAKFVSFVERGRSLNFQERKIRFFCFIRC